MPLLSYSQSDLLSELKVAFFAKEDPKIVHINSDSPFGRALN